MNKGVVGGLIVAGLAGLAGFALYKRQNNDSQVAGGADIGGGYSGGGIPDLSPFLPGGNTTPTNPLSPVVLPDYQTPTPTTTGLDTIMKMISPSIQPSDEAADNVQAQTLANALTETNLASSNMIYNNMVDTAGNYKNDNGTYTGFGFTYDDLNQFKGELARQAAIQSIGAEKYFAMSTGQQSVLLSSIMHGKADTVDSSGVAAKDKLPNGNITQETFDKLLSDTLAGTTPTPTPTSSGGSSGTTYYAPTPSNVTGQGTVSEIAQQIRDTKSSMGVSSGGSSGGGGGGGSSSHNPSSSNYSSAADKAYSASKSAASQKAAASGTLKHNTRPH